jgi:hypothetical protein
VDLEEYSDLLLQRTWNGKDSPNMAMVEFVIAAMANIFL